MINENKIKSCLCPFKNNKYYEKKHTMNLINDNDKIIIIN